MNAAIRSDKIETRADLAKTVLDVLMIALDSDSPPTGELIQKAIGAATELLTVE